MIEAIDLVNIAGSSDTGGGVEATVSHSMQSELFSEETKLRARQDERQEAEQHSGKKLA